MINGLPARLREMRERSSLSQREVARRINVSAAQIHLLRAVANEFKNGKV